MTKVAKWEFLLDKGERQVINSDITAREMARLLMAMPADGYVHDDVRVIPVRRIVFGHRFEEFEQCRR